MIILLIYREGYPSLLPTMVTTAFAFLLLFVCVCVRALAGASTGHGAEQQPVVIPSRLRGRILEMTSYAFLHKLNI